jgi:hypothetical protein
MIGRAGRRPSERGGIVRGVVRLLVLAVVAAAILGIGMRQYGWKPFGERWTWARLAGSATKTATAVEKPVAQAVDEATRDVAGEVVGVAQDAGETIGEAAGKVGAKAGDALQDAVQGVREKMKDGGDDTDAADGLTEGDRDARDELLKDKGL